MTLRIPSYKPACLCHPDCHLLIVNDSHMELQVPSGIEQLATMLTLLLRV